MHLLDSRGVDDIRLAFPGTDTPALALGTGVHDIGRGTDGEVRIVATDQHALVRFCVDRRGVWLTVDDASCGVHVNGRPVRRMAMLRPGDAVYVDGIEMALVTATPSPAIPARLGNAPAEDSDDPRVLLRGIGGRYHGRSLTLERPRLVGRSVQSDIRIDDAAFADRHARIDLQGETVVLRDLGSTQGSMVNGVAVRDAVLRPGDQIMFDAHHRFVVEAPGRVATRHDAPPDMADDELDLHDVHAMQRSTRRLPWLLLAALLIAAGLSALLLFGVSA